MKLFFLIYTDYQTVTGRKTISGTIHVMNQSNLQTSDLNGLNLSNLWADAVLIDVPQEIYGHKTFIDGAVFDNLNFHDTLDEVTDWDIKKNWMLRDKFQTVEGSIIFEKELSAKDLKVGLINGIDIQRLKSEIVKLNEVSEVEGPLIFQNVLSNGNIKVTGKIQGIDISEEAVLRNSTVITGEKTFLHDLIVEGDITADGKVDGIHVEEICSKIFIPDKVQNVSRLTIKGDVIFQEGVTVLGNLAGVNLRLLHEIAIRKDGSKVTFAGLKKFSNVSFEGVRYFKFTNFNLLTSI